MKIYTGIDIVSNLRIKTAYERFGEKFLNKVYTDREVQYCMKKRDFIGCLAARFAGKEAFIKAFYKCYHFKPSFKEIEVYGSEGQPANIMLHLQTFDLSVCKIDISISHERDYSSAFVILIVD